MAMVFRPEDLVGRELGGLRLTTFLAAGGMGWVYRAENVLNPGIVRAVKVLRPDLATGEDFQRSFSREAEAIERLRHPGVVGFYGLRADQGFLLMEQELLVGEDLRTLIARDGAPPVATVVAWLREAADALAAAHALPVVHRDVKPSNLYLTREGRIKVLDFGLARSPDLSGATGTRTTVGTVAYMAPEVITDGGRAATPATDVYGLGITAWELLTGKHPFQAKMDASEYAVQHAHVHDAVPRVDAVRPDVPGWLVDVVARAVAKRPADRQADGAALARELAGPGAVADPPPIPKGEPADATTRKRPDKPTKSPGSWVVTGALGVLGLAFGLSIAVVGSLTVLGNQLNGLFSGIADTVGSASEAAPERAVPRLLAATGRPDRVEILVNNGGVSFSESAVFGVGETRTMLAAPWDGDRLITEWSSCCSWISDNPPVASVDESGQLVALAEGTATVSATVDGVTGSTVVRVGPPTPAAPPGERELRSPTLGLLKWIPAGTFTMGSAEGVGDPDEHPAHRVTLSQGYWLMEMEVTQGMWIGENPSKFATCGATCPVERVSWDDAVAFANAVSRREGLREAYRSGEPVPGADGYRLPTEAEWEYAARGGQSYVYAGSDEATDVGWIGGSSTYAACGKARNGYGLCDMTGNVWEWTGDWHGAYPSPPQKGSARVNRGGGWDSAPALARVANRFRDVPANRSFRLGFRLARSSLVP